MFRHSTPLCIRSSCSGHEFLYILSLLEFRILNTKFSVDARGVVVCRLRFNSKLKHFPDFCAARIAESSCCNGSPPAPKPPKPVKEKKPKKEKKDSKKGAEGAPDAKDAKSSGKDKGKDAAGAAPVAKAESKPTPFQVSAQTTFMLLDFQFFITFLFQIPIHHVIVFPFL